MVLPKMTVITEVYPGHVIGTVPAYFNDVRLRATKDAVTTADLQILRFVNEPTSAATAYGLIKKGIKQKIIVYDLRDRSSTVSLFSFDDGVFEVLAAAAAAADSHPGSEDFDNRVIDYVKIMQEDQGRTCRTTSMCSANSNVRSRRQNARCQASSHTCLEIKSFEQWQ